MATTPEGKIKSKLTAMLKQEKVWYFMPANNGFGKSGIPDVVGICCGIFIGIECKSDAHKKPTQLQLKRSEEIKKAGGLWFLVYDEDTIEDVRREIGKVKKFAEMQEVRAAVFTVLTGGKICM